MKNSFIKDSLMLMSGTIFAQLLSICVSPLMTRIYTEQQIGEYTLILTAVSMFGSVICGRYDMSIVSEPDKDNIYPLLKLSFIITIILSVIVSIGYSIYYIFLEDITLSFMSVFLWVLIFLLLSGIGNILVAYNNRCKDYTLMTSAQVSQSLGKNIPIVLLGVLKTGTVGLLLSQCSGVLLGLKKQAKNIKKDLNKIFKSPLNDVYKVAKMHKKQPLYSVPASFVNSFSYSVLNLFVSSLFGIKILAYYSLSFRMLGLPLQLLSINVSKVFFEKASREYDEKNNFRKVFLQTTILLSVCSIIMVIILLLWAPELFRIFFGEGWERAGEFVRILAPMFGIRLVVSALTPTIIIAKKQNLELCLQLLFLFSAILSYSLTKAGRSIEYFLILISISYSIVYIIYYIILFALSKNKENQYD